MAAEQGIGTPDDLGTADGAVVLSYAQAVAKAQAVQVEARQPQPRHYGEGLKLNDVMDYYLDAQLAGKGSKYDSRRSWALHGTGSISTRLVTSLDADTLRKWHKAMAAKAPTRRGKEMDFDPADRE
ncbi:MAG: hypothetical protein ABJA62_02440 [Luteimonas sp.]